MRWTSIVAVSMLFACGDGEASSEAANRDSAAAAQPTTEIVHATVDDTSIVLSVDTVPAGDVSILFANRGASRHSVRIQSVDDSWAVSNIMSGEDATLRLDLSPGTYELYCPDFDANGSHASQGVYARLVAVESGD